LNALTALAPRLAAGATGVAEVRQLSGGASQELWLVVCQTPDGLRRLVLRRTPPGRTASDLSIPIEAEARLMRLAHANGVPTPPVVHILAPEDGLGAGFFMEHVEGEALGGRIVRDEAFASVRPLLARQCGEILARIHALPRRAAPGLPEKGAAEIIDDLERHHRTENWPRPVFELAFRWLRARITPDEARAVVHGDFRNGNMLIGADGVRAVLDWELAHVGDPLEDLGWICVNSWRFGVIDKPVGGFGAREDLYAGYEAAGGARVDRARARFWEVLGTLRWGVICTLSAMLMKQGGPVAIERPMIARRASETELDLLNLMREAP
jgi:aminoglycoside phosphotransferase (APT) family kinase protein